MATKRTAKVAVARRGKADKGKSRKLVKYKFTPKQVVASIAKKQEKVQELLREKQVAELMKRGENFDVIGQKLGVSSKEAFDIAKAVIAKWTKDVALDAVEARELDLKRYDALLVILWKDAEPHVMVNPENGEPVLDGTTGLPVLIPGDKVAIKLIIDILDKRAKLLGLESAQKMELGGKLELIRREFVGVDPNTL